MTPPEPSPARTRSRTRLTVAVLAGSSLLLGACTGMSGGGAAAPGAGGAGGDTDTTSAPAEVTPGGTLRVAVGSDAGCIDPQQVGSNDSIYSVRQLVDSLTDQDPETGEIVPWLAESWEVSEDATEYTFTLVEGATFSDGTPVDAESVQANFEGLLDLGARAGIGAGYLEGYAGTEIEDERTFTVTFDRPNAQFLQATSTHSLGLLSPETVAGTADERCAEVIGSGPFVLDSYAPNRSISLSQREDYDWGSSLWGHEGAAYLDAVEVSIVPESSVRVGSLQSGQVDLIGNVGKQDEIALQADGTRTFARGNPGIPFSLQLNQEDPLLGDPAVRRAISRAIDRDEVVSTVYTEATEPATAPLSSATPLYTDLSEEVAYDPEGVETTLTEAGFERGADEVWERDGEPLAFEILWFNNAPTNGPALELIQQQLASAGIQVSLREGQVAEWSGIIAEGDFQANWANVTRADPDILRTAYSTDLGNNYRLSASGLDDLLVEQAGEADPERRAESVTAAQEALVADTLTIPVVELTTTLASRDTVHDVTFDSGSRIHLFDTWIEQ